MRITFRALPLLLAAVAPLFSQALDISAFRLGESPDDVRKLLGEPVVVTDINPEFRSWQYRVGDIDHDDFSHALVFRRSTNALVSISRTFDSPVKVDALFPVATTTWHHYPKTGTPELTVRLCVLPNDRILFALGSLKPGDPSTQLVLIHRAVLPIFYPWLAAELTSLP